MIFFVRFDNTGRMANEFKYRHKAILAFQERDGVDVCFFGMYVQQYDWKCDGPNKGMVHIASTDTLPFFQPIEKQRNVLYDILIGYLQWLKEQRYV